MVCATTKQLIQEVEQVTERFTNPCRNCCESFNGERYSWLPICEHCKERITYEKCLKTAEEEGRMVVLPCDTVYFICDKGTKDAHVRTKSILDLRVYDINGIDKDGRYWSVKEEAEKALKKMEGKLWENL